MKRVIISGATGAVGIALIEELVDKGIEVLVLCHKGSNRIESIPKNKLVNIEYCDLEDMCFLKNRDGKKYDVFYHFAWNGTTGESRNDMYLQNQNVRYSLDAVRVAFEFGCETFVGAGSQAEYGRVEGLLSPNLPTFPENGYGIAKLCAGQMTREYSHQLGIKHVWVRILSVYGPCDGKKSMVMSTINKLREGGIPEFTKGEQVWDYLYSGDAAKAFCMIGDNPVDGKVYVLGSGKARPLSEYIVEIRDAVNPNAEICLGAIPYAERQVMHLQADITELQEEYGFEPLTKFSEGIKHILERSI